MRYTVETVSGDELEAHETLTDATRNAVSRLEDDPELGELHVYEIGRTAPMGEYLKTIPTHEHVKTIIHGPDAHWNSVVVMLDPDEKVGPPKGAYLPRRITEEDLEGYALGDPKRASLERQIGEWI